MSHGTLPLQKFEPNPKRIYLGDNGRALCGLHLGYTAYKTGHDLSGQPLVMVPLAEARLMAAQGSAPRCEVCNCATTLRPIAPIVDGDYTATLRYFEEYGAWFGPAKDPDTGKVYLIIAPGVEGKDAPEADSAGEVCNAGDTDDEAALFVYRINEEFGTTFTTRDFPGR